MTQPTLNALNDWALEQIKGFIPSPTEALDDFVLTTVKRGFLNGWLTTSKQYLQDSGMSNKAIIYFAIREYVGEANELFWLIFIKDFVESNHND
jgi:hypothetical protein